MTASALTAVSATALLSFVGVWGTVLGMGLLSILTVLGNYMYSSFIHRTAERVKEVRPVVVRAPRTREFGVTDPHVPDATRVDLEPITTEHINAAGDETVEDTSSGEDDDEDRSVGRLRAAWDAMVERYGMRRIVLSIVAVFVLLAGTVTVIETLAGKPMADIVRNEGGSGTSVFGGSTSDGSGSDDSDDSDPSNPDQDTDQQDRRDDDTQGDESPADEQQRDESPGDETPTEDTSTEDPSSEDPPAEDPPAEDPLQDEPEDEQPPGDEQQFNEPPADEPQQDAPPAE